jgi:hypothetical protein
MSSWAALKRPETVEKTHTATASAPAGRPAMAAARASSALETSASSRKAARATAKTSGRSSASWPTMTIPWAARAVGTTAVAAAARTESN